MKEAFESIPELFYDFIAIFMPGFVAMELIYISPAMQQKFSYIVSTQTLIDKSLVLIIGSYIFGQAITMLSDIVIRRPVWLLFGDPEKNLLGNSAPLIKAIPGSYDSKHITTLKSEIESVISISCNNLKLHSVLDICEQYVKKNDYAAGMLCQKRHGIVVLCRNIAMCFLLAMPCYWSMGMEVRLCIIAGIIIFLLRWNYLRIRRSQFLYSCFHIAYVHNQNKNNNPSN